MRPHCFLALLTLLTLAAAAATREVSPPWKEIKDLKDPYPYVISIAEWGGLRIQQECHRHKQVGVSKCDLGGKRVYFRHVLWADHCGKKLVVNYPARRV
ncbi:hypothetical protein ACFX15_010103 [Malus domestica]